MTNEQVIKRINEIREILADYRELTSYDHEALDIAISALSKHCASSEQADTKLFNRGYWLMPGEVFISHNVLNEVLNTIIKSINTEQRKIDSILAKTSENDEAIHIDDQCGDDTEMVDQFREVTKKTDEVSISKHEVLTNIRKLCDGCYLMEHCGQCNPNCLLRKAMDVVEKIKTDSERVSPSEQEKSNSFSEELSEEGNSEMNCSDEWWKNYIRSRMSQDDRLERENANSD